MKNVLITGASGLIGSTLASLLNNDYNLICLVRDHNKIDKTINARFIVADVRYNLLDHFKDIKIDTIYHLAALNPLFRNKRMQREVNINGMKNIIQVARATNTKHFIYVQGMGLFNEEIINEDTPINPDTEFARIRWNAQQLLYDNKDAFNICIPILGDVYGEKGWFMEMVVKRLMSNKFWIPGNGEYYRSFIHVYDAANALRMLGESESNGYYIVCDDQPTRFIDFIYYTADRLRVKRPGKISPFLARFAIGSDMLRLLMKNTKASNAKLKQDLNFRLRFPEYKAGIDEILSKIRLI